MYPETGRSGSQGTVTGSAHGRLRSAGVTASILVIVLLTTLFAHVGTASAYWSSTGKGSAASTTGTLLAPTSVVVPSTSAKNVAVSWAPSEGALAPSGYIVTRRATTGPPIAACGTDSQSLITATSCTDANVPDGSYTYQVTAVFNSWTARSARSSPVKVVTPTKLAFTVQPSDSIAGAPVAPSVAVSLQASDGLTVPAADFPVTLSLATNPGAGTLSGALTVLTDSSGKATFLGVSVDKAASGYVLSATSTGLSSAISSAFTVTAGAATKLAFTSLAVSGSASATANLGPITVQRQDRFGNPVSVGSHAVAVATNSTGLSRFAVTSGGSTVTSLTIPAGSSTASFFYGDTKAATPTMTVTSNGLAPASQSVRVTPGAAAKLLFDKQPTNTRQAEIIPTVTARVADAFDNTVADSAAVVRISISERPPLSSGDLSGTVQSTAVNGVITYSDLQISGPSPTGTYKLQVTAALLSPATSTAFDITS